MTHNGYLMVRQPDHPYADAKGYVRVHRLVMEKHLGRYLTPDEDCHHKDRDKLNNQIANLEIMSRSDHTKLHLEAGEVGWGVNKI